MNDIKFCPSCGHRLEVESPLFCPACGHRLPIQQNSPSETLSTSGVLEIDSVESVNSSTPKIELPVTNTLKPKVKSWWKWVVILVLILGGAIGYFIYEDAQYPKTESAAHALLLNRYWKITDGATREVYIDGKKITKSGSDIRYTIKDAVEGNSEGAIYEILDKGLKDIIERDNFITVRKLKNGKLFYFEMNYSNSAREYTYETQLPELIYKAETSRYQLSIPDGLSMSSSMSTGEWIQDDDGTPIKNYVIQISKLKSDKLELKVDITVLQDGQEFRIVVDYTCDIVVLPNTYIERVDKELDIANNYTDEF